MKPYYEDEAVTIYHGDCRDVLPHLPPVELVLTDPPYGEGLGFENDSVPTEAAETIGGCLSSLHVEPGTYLASFWTMRSLDLLLDEVRARGWCYLRTLAMHVAGTARPHLGFLPRLQPIVLFRLGARSSELHDRFAPVASEAIRKSGLSCGQIAKELGCDSRLVMKWSRYRDPSWCLPTARFYKRFKELVALGDTFDFELATRGRDAGFQPQFYQHDLFTVREGVATSGHPAEKPLAVIRSLLVGLPGDLILDPFMGSGTTLRAAKDLGRKAIGIEIEERYCEIAAKRMAQAVLPL